MDKIKNLSIKLVLATLLSVSINGCGSSSSDEDAPTTYNLQQLFLKDYSYEEVETSSDNKTRKYAHTLKTQAESLLNGKAVIPVNVESKDINTTSGAVKSTDTSILLFSKTGIYMQRTESDGTICSLDNTPTPLPTKAKIGDKGTGETLVCTDGGKSTSSWALISKDSKVVLQKIYISYESSGSKFFTSTDNYYINDNAIWTDYSSTSVDDITGVTYKVAKTTINSI